MPNAPTDLSRSNQLLHDAGRLLETAGARLAQSSVLVARGEARAEARAAAAVTYDEPPTREGGAMAPQTPFTILLIDDEPGFVSALARLLRHDGSTVDTAADGYAALTHLQVHHYDVVLCDLRMPALDGAAFYALLCQQHAYLRQRVLFLTGDTLGADSTAFLEQCGQPWVYKPCDAAAIRHAMQQMLHAAATGIGVTGEAVADTGQPRPEEGTLSIVQRGQRYQVRYASNNPYAPEHPMRECGDEDTLDALLHALGMEGTAMQDACAIAQHGGVAVLYLRVAPGQIQTCFHPTV